MQRLTELSVIAAPGYSHAHMNAHTHKTTLSLRIKIRLFTRLNKENAKNITQCQRDREILYICQPSGQPLPIKPKIIWGKSNVCPYLQLDLVDNEDLSSVGPIK